MKKKLSIVLTLCLLGGVGSYNLLNVGATDYEAEAGFVSEDINEEDFTAETEEQNTEEPDVFKQRIWQKRKLKRKFLNS